jgi:hypothetical protein
MYNRQSLAPLAERNGFDEGAQRRNAKEDMSAHLLEDMKPTTRFHPTQPTGDDTVTFNNP